MKRLLILLFTLLAIPLIAETPADYASLPGRKAMAMVPGFTDSIYGIGHSQSTDIGAAASALQECQRKLAEHTEIGPTPAQTCEVVNLNQELITTGADIRAQIPDKPHPLYLWRYTSATATVYLAGSIHILKSTIYPLAPQLEKAFEQSDLLVLEVDTEKYSLSEMQRRMMEVSLLQDGQTLKKVLDPAVMDRLNESLARYGINTQQIAQFKPAMVMNQLVVLRLMTLGYLPEYGLEQHFRAKLNDKRILELESLDMQLDVLFNQPLDLQIQLLTDTLELEHEIEPVLADMVGAWLAGNDRGLLALILQQSGTSELSQAFSKRILDDRNVTMAKTIGQYLDTVGTYFVLAGVAHFIGESSIVSLLKQQGINGKRVMSDEQI